MRQKVLTACQLQYQHQQDVVCHILVAAVVVDDHLMFWAAGLLACRPAAMPLACLTLTLLPHQPVPLEVPLPQLL